MPEIETLERLREICLELPEAFEEFTWDSETFRVRKKIFAMHSGGDTQSQVWLKGRPGDQEMLIAAEPARFFRPPYLGPKGWIGIWLNDRTDWDEVADLVETSFRLVAPKRLAATLDREG